MRFKWSYAVIPLLTVVVAGVAGWFTQSGLAWYDTLEQPVLTPPSWVFSTAWSVIYPAAAVSAVRVWNGFPRGHAFNWVIGLFTVNAVLNAAWTGVFFAAQWLSLAVVVVAVLTGVTAALILDIWPEDRVAAVLLAPYVAWLGFATYLTAGFWVLNAAV